MISLAQSVSIDGSTAIYALAISAGVILGATLLIAFVIVPIFNFGGRATRHIGRFIIAELGDGLRIVGALLMVVALVPLTLLNIIIGRWSASSHYGRAIESEFRAMGAAIYRMAVGHPARVMGLGAMTEGIEKRLPAVVAGAPGADFPRPVSSSGGATDSRAGQFEGWKIIGSLPGGGSGAKLYIAQPSIQKIAALARQGIGDVDRVVIKSFSLREGSTLPQIVRESRALPAARRLGLILEHDLNPERFFYITRYVPGESLSLVTQRMHAEVGGSGGGSGGGGVGLDPTRVRAAVSYATDLLKTLSLYHAGGLWHKDVKPDNVIISNGHAHLVDFGLITPLRSSMTLTTHGTEYFRDPEMVRMALRGAKVHEVDGAKFDIYAVGAVLYAILENSFPAHGGLSQLTKRCPESLSWIIRRAMTDYDKRYDTAGAMLADLDVLLRAPDPFAVKPGELPSVRAQSSDVPDAAINGHISPAVSQQPAAQAMQWEAEGPAMATPAVFAGAGVGAAAATPHIVGAHSPSPFRASPSVTPGAGSGEQPRIQISNWWTGRYKTDIPANVAAAAHAMDNESSPFIASGSPSRRVGPVGPSTAAQQLVRARARIAARRERAQTFRTERRAQFEPAGVNTGVIIAALALLLFVGLVAIPAGLGLYIFSRPSHRSSNSSHAIIDVPRTDPWGNGSSLAKGTPPAIDNAWILGEPDADAVAWRNRALANADKATPAPAGDVLVLRDPSSYSNEMRADVDAQVRALIASGLSIIGERGVETVGNEAPADEDELVASLRQQIGVQLLGTDSARRPIADWLAAHPQVATVVWAGRADSGNTRTWIVGRDASDSVLAQTTRVAIALVHAPKNQAEIDHDASADADNDIEPIEPTEPTEPADRDR